MIITNAVEIFESYAHGAVSGVLGCSWDPRGCTMVINTGLAVLCTMHFRVCSCRSGRGFPMGALCRRRDVRG
eukprot:6110874-Pyramimonas_sp.AAC.1